MTDDVETRLRAALRYNADRVGAVETDLRSPPRARLVPLLAAAACVLLIVGVGVVGRSLVSHGHRQAPAASDSSFVGRRWLLTSVRYNGRTVKVPAAWLATVDFEDPPTKCPRPHVRSHSCPGVIAINDTLNYISGIYRTTAAGFATSDLVTTAVGYDGRDPVRVEVIDALGAVGWGRTDGAGSDGNPRVGATITAGGTLTLAALDYTLVFVAYGNAPVDTSSPSPTTDR